MESIKNESLLVQAMQSGSEEAFTALYRYYSPQLYLNILKLVRDPLLAEDMVQELFTRIWLKRESPGLKENFAGYMYRVGQHLVHDFFRKVKRDRRLLERFRSFAELQYEHIEEAMQHQQSSAVFKKAIDLLPPQQKKVYELVKLEGYTYKQAAGIMGISPLTVKEYLAASNKSIRSYVLSHIDGAPGLLLCIALCASLS
jgi:RNA polymerase sigma factor (sigma-70 family)